MMRTCDNCGTEFPVRGKGKKNEKRFCCPKCRMDYWKKKRYVCEIVDGNIVIPIAKVKQ